MVTSKKKNLIMLRFDRKQQNFVKQLSFNKKKLKKYLKVISDL